jgi:predicted GNAT family acetyltransferase
MDVRAYDEPAKFRSAVGDFYLSDPVRHTTAVTVMSHFLDDPTNTPVMITVHRGGDLHGVAFRTPPWPLIVSGLPTGAASVVAGALTELDPDLPAVNGPRELAEAFAAAWTAHTGARGREVMASRLYALDDLLPPTVPGRGRLAREADAELLIRWRKAFVAEAVPFAQGRDRSEAMVRDGLSRGDGLVIWEHDGHPVSTANAAIPSAGMTRVNAVYTPPEWRGRGYGSAATAVAARWALDAGAEHVLLYTDLANPTSNSIYQKIGFRPVFDASEIEFTAATEAPPA